MTQGLVCRIVDKDHPDDVWIKWIEIVPLRPTSYIKFDGRVDKREIQFTARPAEADGKMEFPPEIAEKPVPLVIRGDGTLFPSASLVPDAFNAIKPQAQLSIQPVPGVGGRPTVALDVDGVPRAVSWRVDFENQRVDQIRNPAAVRIERAGMAGVDKTAARMYRMKPFLDYPPIDEKQWPTIVDVGGDRICAFDISRGVRPLELLLRVDAPPEAFNTVGGGNAIVLRWENDVQTPHRLYDDRDIRAQIVKFTDDGGLVIATSVGDFSFSLRPPGLV